MAQNRDSSPIYYREIQKNAYLKRIPEEPSGSKLRPLGLKKAPVKPLWTQLCIHNGRTPYLEQYKDAITARAHRPIWRHSLLTARHVTASVNAKGDEYDFLVDTDDGPVRMMAPDWESMQDWVTTLRSKLTELRIVQPTENVYCAPKVPAAPRAPARDPTSPLPPPPHAPPQRVPGIDLTPITRPQTQEQPEPETIQETNNENAPENVDIDISNWEPFQSLPSTSQVPTKKVAKICGQNICLDDSIFKRNSDGSDDDFDIDNLEEESYKQTVLVSDVKEDNSSDNSSNITVIQVSNKPTDSVFNFDTNQANESSQSNEPSFINIVNTENQNEYGTVFENGDYGHLSLTTTVSLTGDVGNVTLTDVKTSVGGEELYERLCLASTDINCSPLAERRVLNEDKGRKSSLPNLERDNSSSTYECVFFNDNNNESRSRINSVNRTTNLTVTSSNLPVTSSMLTAMSSNKTLPSASTVISSVSTSNTANMTTSSSNMPVTSSSLTAISSNVTSTLNMSSTSNMPSNIPPISSNMPQIINTESNSNSRVHINAVSISNNSNINAVRPNIARTHSQNSNDRSPRRNLHQYENSPTNGRIEREVPKPIWKRGLTELSLLTRLRGIAQGKRQESPNRNTADNERSLTHNIAPNKVVHRSRPEVRHDARRRSNSLSNGNGVISPQNSLQPLRARQAAFLRNEQRRGTALVATIKLNEQPIFTDYNKQVWVCACVCRVAGSCRAGDRVAAVGGHTPKDSQHALQILHKLNRTYVDILFHRVPLAKIYVINKKDQESLGIKLDNECNITHVEADSPAAKAGVPPPGKWAITEVNNRHINLIKGGEEEMNRLSYHGTEASILIQPSPLVKKIRAAMKGNKSILGLR